MDGVIKYLNTDLDLVSADDLAALGSSFAAGGIFALNVSQEDDGLWHAKFETEDEYAEPELNIAAMLSVVESQSEPLRATWGGCTRREFNIGYDCGSEPWAFNQTLSSELLHRMAAVGASLRVTLYPETEGTRT